MKLSPPLVGLVLTSLLTPFHLAWCQVSILQNRNDLAAASTNLSEVTLTTSNVSVSTFGRLFSYPSDGEIVAQPLYVARLATTNGVHNVLYIATMHNVVYALDADDPLAAQANPLWVVDFNKRAGNDVAPFKATDVTGLESENYPVSIGILSTPVIDPDTRTMYLVVSTSESGGKVMRLHAIDIVTGDEKTGSPIVLGGVYTAGGRSLIFNPQAQSQRAGLVFSNKHLIIAFSSHDDQIPFQGWVMAYDKGTLQQTGIFSTMATGATFGGGIWQAGRPPAVDARGLVYIATGNGVGPNGYDGVHNFGESILCLDPERGLQLVDWFTASNWPQLDGADLDLSGSGPMLLPGTSLLAAGGKEGVLYIVDTSNMGKLAAGDTQIVQKQQIVSSGHIMGGPVFWNAPAAAGGPMLYHSGESDVLRAFSFDGRRISATAVMTSREYNSGHPGAILSLSANGTKTGTGIIWSYARAQSIPWVGGIHEIMPGILRAYDAENVSRLLWTNQLNSRRDDAGLFAKFSVPSVANGKVYLSTWSNQVVVYGLLPTGPDFLLTAQPARNVALGGVADYRIDMTRLNGYGEAVSWSVYGLPSGAGVSLLGPNPDGSMTLHVQLAGGTAPGVFWLNVVATGASKRHSQAVLLVVSDNVAIPRGNLSIRYVDSQELANNNGAVNAIDGNSATLWTTQWVSANPPYPHEIQIDLGTVYNVSGFSYLPRQDNTPNGTIRKFEAYVSLDGVTWGTTIHDGSFDYPNSNFKTRQLVMFQRPKAGRYLRLRANFEVNFLPWASAAEINVFASGQSALPPSSADVMATAKGADGAAWIKRSQAGSWSFWYSMAGQILDDPLVVASANGKWDLFALGADHTLLTQTNLGSGWLGWSSLGGGLASRPVAAVSANGRIDVLVKGTDNGIWARSRVGGGWSSWYKLGDCVASVPAIVVGSDGLVFLFARSCDNAIWTRTLVLGTWSGWNGLGGSANSDVTATVTRNGDIYIFIIGGDKAVYYLKRTATGAWGTWTKLGPAVVGNYVSPVALPNGDVWVFALGTDKRIYSGSISQATGSWTGWSAIRLHNYWTALEPAFAAPPRAVVDAVGNVLLTGLTTNGDLWETRTVYGQWTLWAPSN